MGKQCELDLTLVNEPSTSHRITTEEWRCRNTGFGDINRRHRNIALKVHANEVHSNSGRSRGRNLDRRCEGRQFLQNGFKSLAKMSLPGFIGLHA
ncbi:hypothetical protein XELAEV_18006029mg [Xenopus laevis]|uniref:Uncharacterized protein n=1 Tax=Xenopus laevis TaxID=8355 RepID=A0A974I370_XENLA|nr:hypothetical protein XELAEV_18006029mg [Xenopus laevis]